KSLSEEFCRAHSRDAARWLGRRGTPAAYARRRSRAAYARRHRGEIPTQRQARRLERRARGGGAEINRRPVRRAGGADSIERVGAQRLFQRILRHAASELGRNLALQRCRLRLVVHDSELEDRATARLVNRVLTSRLLCYRTFKLRRAAPLF